MKLIIKEADKEPREIELERKAYVIGRDSSCDIIISDNRVSSRHLFLTPRREEWWIRDLGSTNGTFLNGRQVSVSRLQEGDIVKIGHTIITLGEPSSYSPTSSPTQLTTRVEIVPSPPSTLEEAKKIHRHLEVLCEISRVLNSLLTVEEALQKTMDLIFQVLRADRGVIFLEDKGRLKITAERKRKDDVSPLQISHSIVEEVFKGEESVLTSDAMEDVRFRNRASIVSSHIHSAMCVPLKGREKNMGVIYVDTLLSKGAFQEEDLELLTVIGHQAGMSIENARLYEENLRREKLAGIGMAIAGMAHYVKNIIQGLKGGETLVELGMSEKKPVLLQKGWEIVKRAIARVEDLIMNMLTYSKERKPVKKPTHLNELIEEVLELFQVKLKEHKILIESKLDPEVKEVMIDPKAIHRAILNLLTNAIEAIGENGKIIFSTHRVPRGIEIKVSDTGKGIPEEILPQLFTPFTSGKGTEGTGLGLAATHKIIREHGGGIRVESKVNHGTTFTIFLPFT